jgi:hypothetical protein
MSFMTLNYKAGHVVLTLRQNTRFVSDHHMVNILMIIQKEGDNRYYFYISVTFGRSGL